MWKDDERLLGGTTLSSDLKTFISSVKNVLNLLASSSSEL